MNNELLFHKLTFLNEMFEKRNKKNSNTNLSRGQGRIIAILQLKDGFSTKDLSNILNVRVASLNETLNKLEKNEYIKKVQSKKDKRVLIIKLTDKGREYKPQKPKDIDIFDCLDESEKKEFNNYLTRITQEYHIKLRNENPKRFEKMVMHRKEVFEKYFGYDCEEWFKLLDNK